MSSYRFRLENVLMVRKIHQSVALAGLARATRAVDEAGERQRLARELYEALRAPAGAVTGDTFHDQRAQGDRLADAVELATDETGLLEAERELRLEEAVAAARAVRALERLDDRHRARAREDAEHREARELDEVATAAYVRAALEQRR